MQTRARGYIGETAFGAWTGSLSLLGLKKIVFDKERQRHPTRHFREQALIIIRVRRRRRVIQKILRSKRCFDRPKLQGCLIEVEAIV